MDSELVRTMQAFIENKISSESYLRLDKNSPFEATSEEGNVFTARVIESYDGEEGGATETYVIFTVDEFPGRFWKINGRYDSWDGTEWYEGWYEVIQKAVVKYEYHTM